MRTRLLQRFYDPKSSARPTRRDMLGGALALGAGLVFLRPSRALGEALPAAPKRRIGIVGAGFAGLSAAYELQRVGYAVDVFEARKRPGGRVITLDEPGGGGRVMEGGGEFIGTAHQVWQAYAEQFGLKLAPTALQPAKDAPGAQMPMDVDGRRLTGDETSKLEADITLACKRMNADGVTLDPVRPWDHPHAQVWDAMSVAQWIDKLPVSQLAKRVLHLELAGENAVPTARQSYLGQLCQVVGGGFDAYWSSTSEYRCAGGNAGLAHAFARAIGKERIHYESPVTQIMQDARGIYLTVDAQDHKFDHVVLAAPPSVWHRIRLPASPAWPAPQMGKAVKRLIWSKSDISNRVRREGNGVATSTWEVRSEGKPSAWVMFSSGDDAEAMHALSEAQRDKAYAAELKKQFPSNDLASAPQVFMDWLSDPWTKAGYSFPAPKEITTFGQLWSRGIGRLHFAGEHTYYAFVGYMEGALRSGRRVAQTIAERDHAAIEAGAAKPK